MEEKRIGARSYKDLDSVIMDKLNKGELETVNLTEWLAVDQRLLLNTFLKQNNRQRYLKLITSEIDKLKKQTNNTLNETIGINLLSIIEKEKDYELMQIASSHISDTIRCWVAYTIGFNQKLTLSDKLAQIQPFAADTHFGVREIAWMTLRSSIMENLVDAIDILRGWSKSDNEYIRRFASEATRPRGVWCQHIEFLKQQPELAINILEPLKADTSKYVRDSVGNWLNDASKSRPEFVRDLCVRWQTESSTKETAYIIKKALRTLEK